jgi:hypothetical protein
MSGGIEEVYNLTSLRRSLNNIKIHKSSDLTALDHKSFWEILNTARKKHSVIGCNIEVYLKIVYILLKNYYYYRLVLQF